MYTPFHVVKGKINVSTAGTRNLGQDFWDEAERQDREAKAARPRQKDRWWTKGERKSRKNIRQKGQKAGWTKGRKDKMTRQEGQDSEEKLRRTRRDGQQQKVRLR
jgi:hypothetical protein